jgi:chromosome segregation and condensation protein ScpB
MTREKKMVAQAVIQAIFVSPNINPETLRRKIGEAFADSPGNVPKAGKMTAFQWSCFLLEVDSLLSECGLGLRRGVDSVSIQTKPVRISKVREFLDELVPVREGNQEVESTAAHEVLAICAFKNGATAAEIEQICGVNRGEIIRRLHADKMLCHHRSIPGQGAVWELGDLALKKFGAASVADLVQIMSKGVSQNTSAAPDPTPELIGAKVNDSAVAVAE